MILFIENVRQIPQKGVRPMFNLTDFEKKMIKGLFKKEKPEIIRRVANSEQLTASLNFLKQRSEKVKLF